MQVVKSDSQYLHMLVVEPAMNLVQSVQLFSDPPQYVLSGYVGKQVF